MFTTNYYNNRINYLKYTNIMAVLKNDVKRITLTVPKQFLIELDNHINNFALTDRSRWIIDAAKEKMAKEKVIISEINSDDTT